MRVMGDTCKQSETVPNQLNSSGICNSCQEAAIEQHILQCNDCETKYHADCDNRTPFCVRSFLKSFKGLKNKANFMFVCDHCVTRRENNEASSTKEQLAAVVQALALLTLEVKALKEDKANSAEHT